MSFFLIRLLGLFTIVWVSGLLAPLQAKRVEPFKDLLARIEIPMGSTHKYEIDPETGRVYLDRVVSMPVVYPANYGSLEGTYAEDGDALDALVLTREPIHPGTFVQVRPIGHLRMIDGGEADDKVICVPVDKVDPSFAEIRRMEDLPVAERQRIEAFFRVYKDLPEGRKRVELAGFASGKETRELVRKALAAYAAKSDASGPVGSDRADPEVRLRFAVLGDAEPKPEPRFPNLALAVDDVNRLNEELGLDFVVGVGDIAHKGTLIQYENATGELVRLTRPFYPIMGNEEHGSTVERFLEFAERWNRSTLDFPTPKYVVDTEEVALVFASPDFGRDFSDEGIAWILEVLEGLKDKPVFLIAHGAQVGIFPENPDKGVTHPGFARVVAQPNLAAVISGDLHMDMDRVDHSKRVGSVHYLHIPALERTKIPDETHHKGMFRLFTVFANGEVLVETYAVGEPAALAEHRYGFRLR